MAFNPKKVIIVPHMWQRFFNWSHENWDPESFRTFNLFPMYQEGNSVDKLSILLQFYESEKLLSWPFHPLQQHAEQFHAEARIRDIPGRG